MQEDKAVFDKDVALKMLEGEEGFLKELAEIFINDASEHMSEIEEAVNCRNSEALVESAHKLKGATANFGNNVTTDTAFKLEAIGRENNLDGVEGVYCALVKDIESLVNALKEFVE